MLSFNWFSPLPPAHSGIAHYALQIVPLLAARHEVVLWTDQDQIAPEVHQVGRVVRYNPSEAPWREINDRSISIYHIGNQPDFHGAIWQMSVRQPGIMVLHDLCLHDFFFMFWVHYRKDRASYLAALERWYGGEGRQAGEAFCAGGITSDAMAQRFPLTRQAVQEALGVITHVPGALEKLGEAIGAPVKLLHLPFRITAKALAAGSQTPPYRLVIFGYLSRNRRLGAVLEALAGLREREQFRLEICGKLWDEGQIRGQIDRLGIRPLVKLQSFIPENQLEQRLSSADLAINLRYPSMGEASGTQLQFWQYGLPTMVTRTGWYESLPEDAVAFVRPEAEVEDIQNHLRAFLADPGAFRAMGERGRRALQNHDASQYVDDIVRFAAEALEASPRIPALWLARRVGADLSEWLHPGAAGYLLDRASRQIAALCEEKSDF